MRRVIIESPYAGDINLNLRYLRACMHDSLMRGEAPFASHGLYTQPGVLNDANSEQRRMGIHAGFSWRQFAQATVIYTDLGISSGMQYGIEHARVGHATNEDGTLVAHSIEYRTLPAEVMDEVLRGGRFETAAWSQ